MPTFFYLPSSGDPDVTPTSWLFPNQATPVTYKAIPEAVSLSTAMTTLLRATGTTNPTTIGVIRYVAGPLAAQDITGTVRMVIRALESATGANATVAMAAKVIQSDGSDRGTLLSVTAADSASSPYEMTTTLSSRRAWTATETEPLTLSSVTASTGDYLVVEIGFRSATGTTRNVSLRIGDNAASDLTYGDGETNDYNGWVEFSGAISFNTATQLVIQDATHAQAADNLALTQHNILATQEARHLHAADNIALVQHNILAIQDSSHAHTADELTLTAHPPSTPLVIQDSTHAQTADNLDLVQHNVLAVQDATHAQTADNLDLTQHNILAVQDASHAQTADNLDLTQHNVLAIQDATHSHTADNLTVVYHAPGAATLVIQDGTHAHAADNLDLTQHNILVVQDAAHAQTADNVTLTQHNVLAVQDSAHAHTADNITLTQHNVLAIQDATHSHTADNLTLVAYTPTLSLTIQDATHSQTADNVTLTQHHLLTVQDGLHGQTADNVTLTQHHILTVADALHGHSADNVTLSIPIFSGSIGITVPVKKPIQAQRDDVTAGVNRRSIIIPTRNDIEVD